MALKIGIVGLPNVGKSTLFNALTKTSAATVGNFPFTTIDPNVGVVPVPDERLATLAKIVKTEKIVPATVEFVDIAGLVKGASKGEGLGNQFLAHIRAVDAIALVVRQFKNPNTTHVTGHLDPVSDRQIILLELILADLGTLEKYWAGVEKEQKAGGNVQLLISGLEKIEAQLKAEAPASDAQASPEEREELKQYPFLTLKPILTVFNADEADLLKNTPAKDSLTISAKLERELADLNPDEQKAYLKELGLEASGLERLVKRAYGLLGYITFLTAGEKEVRAWQIIEGTKAPQAAGVIHTDFEKHFIRATVVTYDEFVSEGGWAGCRTKGLVRSEGKDYVFQDGDVVLFQTSA